MKTVGVNTTDLHTAECRALRRRSKCERS